MSVALTYGFQRYSWAHIVAVIIILFVIVQVVQAAANLIARRLDHSSGRSHARTALDVDELERVV